MLLKVPVITNKVLVPVFTVYQQGFELRFVNEKNCFFKSCSFCTGWRYASPTHRENQVYRGKQRLLIIT